MGKKLCKYGEDLNQKGKKFKYVCKKCGLSSTKEEYCCKPKRMKKSA